MNKREAEQLARRIRQGLIVPPGRGTLGPDVEVSVSDYGPGMKTVCLLERGVGREYRSEEDFIAGIPAREGAPTGPHEIRAYPMRGLKLTRS